jgi:hypothetical protein
MRKTRGDASRRVPSGFSASVVLKDRRGNSKTNRLPLARRCFCFRHHAEPIRLGQHGSIVIRIATDTHGQSRDSIKGMHIAERDLPKRRERLAHSSLDTGVRISRIGPISGTGAFIGIKPEPRLDDRINIERTDLPRHAH